MGMAASLSVIVWRMLRVERERSEARVIALTTMAAVSRPAPRASTPRPRAGRRASRRDLAPRTRARPPDLELELEIREAPARGRVGDADVRGA